MITRSHLKTTSAVSAITRNRPLSAISRIRHGLKSRVRFGCLRPSLVYKLPGVTARSLSCLSLALVCLFISGCFFVRVPVHEEQQRAYLLIDQGVLLLRQGDFERAEAAFQLSLDLNPGAAALDGLGCVALLRGDAEGAKRHFNAALEADFRYTDALGNMALLYEQIGDRLRAREYYEQAIERDPSNFRFRNNYAIFLAQNGNGNDQMVRQQLLQAAMLEDLPLISTNLQRVSERKE